MKQEKKQHFCWNVTWPVIWQTFLTKDGISGIGGCSLRRKEAGSVSCGTSFSGRNVGWLWDLRTRAGADIQCGMWGSHSEITEYYVTPGDPTAPAAQVQMTSAACELQRWRQQSPELPGQLEFKQDTQIKVRLVMHQSFCFVHKSEVFAPAVGLI